jgi:hypothetical protein
MPVTVKLYDLVQYEGTERLWPEEFLAFERSLQKDKNTERTAYGACADWLDANDEPELARAYRFVMSKRLTVRSGRSDEEMGSPSRNSSIRWFYYGAPDGVGRQKGIVPMPAHTTIACLMSHLYRQIVQAEEEVKKMQEELR